MIEIIGEREHRRLLLRIALMSAAERECEAEKKRIYILSELFHWTDLGSKGTRMIPGSGLIAEVRNCHAARCAADMPAIFVGSHSFSDETSLSIKKQGNAILVKNHRTDAGRQIGQIGHSSTPLRMTGHGKRCRRRRVVEKLAWNRLILFLHGNRGTLADF